MLIINEKSLYITLTDRNGIVRATIPNGSEIPAGVIAGRGWTVKTEYRNNLKCAKCEDYLYDDESHCSCDHNL